MRRYFAGRLVQAVPVLFGVSVIAFLLLRLIPGDPALAILGDRATPESLARLHRELGLDRPLVEQYFLFVWNALHGQFGTSATYRTDVGPLTFARVPVSLALVVYASAIALAISIPMATLAASRRGGPVDQGVRLLFTAILGIPAFWSGLLLALLLGVKARIFPVSGAGSGGLDTLWHLFLPALTIALAMSPILVRSLRSSLVEVIDADFVTTGQAMGLPRGVILRSYLLRNALLPVILVLSINVAWLLSGTVIAEQVFSIPGVGSLLVNSIGTRDYAIIQLIALLFAMLVLIVNLVTDLVFAFLDPRIKLA
jgi:ABC-type dipeptide/oligopeptide/nickel transport system permease component